MGRTMAQRTHDDTADGSEPETRELWTLDVGAIISLPDADRKVTLIDCKRPSEYGSFVWACEYIDTGEFAGLVTDGAAAAADPVEVEFYGYQ